MVLAIRLGWKDEHGGMDESKCRYVSNMGSRRWMGEKKYGKREFHQNDSYFLWDLPRLFKRRWDGIFKDRGKSLTLPPKMRGNWLINHKRIFQVANECSSHTRNHKFRMATTWQRNEGWYYRGLRLYNTGTVGGQWSLNDANE